MDRKGMREGCGLDGAVATRKLARARTLQRSSVGYLLCPAIMVSRFLNSEIARAPGTTNFELFICSSSPAHHRLQTRDQLPTKPLRHPIRFLWTLPVRKNRCGGRANLRKEQRLCRAAHRVGHDRSPVYQVGRCLDNVGLARRAADSDPETTVRQHGRSAEPRATTDTPRRNTGTNRRTR